MTQELVELKHKVLTKRIEEIDKKLRLINNLLDCQNDIKAIHIILTEYEKMYQAILQSEEYEKYQEIEDTIITKVAGIEAKLERCLYKIAKQYKEIIEKTSKEIEESKNYKNFHDLDNALEKTKILKNILEMCKKYIRQEQELKAAISTLKFKILLRKQVEQMVYQNGGTESNLKQFDDNDEQEYFKILLQTWIEKMCPKDEIVQKYDLNQIMEDNILLNHVIFKLIEQDIEINAEKYIGLLEAPIFNPHLCNISKNPYSYNVRLRFEQYDYKRKYSDNGIYIDISKGNLSLLRAVLKDLINDKNTTIMECNAIYMKFGFSARPIVINEGQEIVRRVFEKVKHKIKSPKKVKREQIRKYHKLRLIPYNYSFKIKHDPFLTTANINEILQESQLSIGLTNKQKIISLMRKTNLTLSEMKSLIRLRKNVVSKVTGDLKNDWRRDTLEEMQICDGTIWDVFKNWSYTQISKRSDLEELYSRF